VWPGEYAEENLFLGIKKVVMVSATATRKTPQMLGISPSDIDYREYPSSFPKANRPIIYLPTAHMNMRSRADGLHDIQVRVNQIIERRLDRKAIIQTVSYKLAREIYLGCVFKEMMLIHDSENTREIIELYRNSTRPVVLVSPVLDTGYDFPYEMAEYQIIVKVPFPVTVDKIVKARADRDPEYKDHVTMVKLVQMAGRICRADDDRGETIIIDSDFGWWYNKIGHRLAPRWFTESVRFEQMLGTPLPKLNRGR
jgi:Rad3-related DNA helicase